MTQNPYAQQPGFDAPAPVSTRTSVAAILSLVCALLCFVPGLALLAVILGIAALVLISSSQGRVTGKGLAVSGILIGILVCIGYGGVYWLVQKGASVMGQAFMGNGTAVMQAIEAKNYSQAKTLLNVPSASPQPSEADFDAFLAAYQSDPNVGTFKSMPQGLLEMIGGLSKMNGIYQPVPGAPIVPIYSEFSNGPAVVLMELPQGYQVKGSPAPTATSLPILNFGIAAKGGKVYWLIPKPGSTPSVPSGTPGSGGPRGGNGG